MPCAAHAFFRLPLRTLRFRGAREAARDAGVQTVRTRTRTPLVLCPPDLWGAKCCLLLSLDVALGFLCLKKKESFWVLLGFQQETS